MSLVILLISGCGLTIPTASGPEINDRAKQILPGTWTGPQDTSITFDANGTITDINFDSVLPPELQGLKLNGSEFEINLPVVGSITATLTLQKAIVNDDGSVEVVYKGQASGGIAGLLGSITDSYVTINITGQLDDVNNPTTLTGTVTGTASVAGTQYPIGGQSGAQFTVNKT